MSDPAPLTSEQKAALAETRAAYRKLMRPARVASFNGWTVGIFGGLSVLWGLVSGGGGIFVGIALLAVAWNELRGMKRLRALDPEGATILGWNQLILGVVIAIYCVFAIAHAAASPDPSMQEMEELAGIPADLVASLTTFLYGSVLVVVAIVQALLARYHFGMRPKVEAFRRSTPSWMVDLIA